jgi:hypothetical protein
MTFLNKHQIDMSQVSTQAQTQVQKLFLFWLLVLSFFPWANIASTRSQA